MDDPVVVAIGVGCRNGCPAEAVQELVKRALESWRLRPEKAVNRLFTIVDKRDDAAIQRAAAALGYELRYLSREALRKVSPKVQTRSAVALARFGVHSVAEAAALAGAGADATLVVPRMSENGATCAIASVLSPLQKVLTEGSVGMGQQIGRPR